MDFEIHRHWPMLTERPAGTGHGRVERALGSYAPSGDKALRVNTGSTDLIQAVTESRAIVAVRALARPSRIRRSACIVIPPPRTPSATDLSARAPIRLPVQAPHKGTYDCTGPTASDAAGGRARLQLAPRSTP